MDSTAVTINDSSSSDDSSDSCEMVVDGSENQDSELDKFYDPDTFDCISNDGVKILARDSTDYGQIRSEFESLFQMNDPSFDESNYKQFVTMAMTLDDLELIRKACERYCSLYGYEDSLVLSWLYRELKAFTVTQDKSILQFMYDNIFQKSLKEKYSRIMVYKLAHFTKYYPDKEAVWNYIFDNFLYDFESAGKLVKLWAETLDTSVSENCEKMVEIFEKVLSIPHLDMDKTYIDFKVMVTKESEKFKVDWEYVQEDFEKAQAEADVMVAYENELECATAVNRATMFKLYLTEVGDKLDRKVRKFIFERMVAECSDSSCWLLYLNYLKERRYDESDDLEIERVLDRAIHLGEPHDEFFTTKMKLLERSKNKVPLDEIKEKLTKTIELALASPFSHPDMSTNVWLEYLTILRRLTDCSKESEVEMLRKNFDLAWNSLSRQWGDAADKNGEILKFQARLEYQVLENPDQGRDLWNSVLGFGNNSQNSAIWLEFIEMEAAVNHVLARRLYKRAVHMPELQDPETLANAWIRFERVHGDADQLKNCKEHCEEVLKKFHKMWKEEEEKANAANEKKAQRSTVAGKKDLKRKPELQKSLKMAPKKPKLAEKPKEVGPTVPSAPQQPNTTNDHLKVFVSNLDYTLSEEEIRASFPELTIRNVDLVIGPSGKSRGFCYLELSTAEEVKLALSFDRRPINQRPAYISTCLREKAQRTKKFQYDEGVEKNKLFVKGCGNSTQEELEVLFKPFGTLKEVRMAFHKSGKSKGIAYVEYESEAAASAAVLKMDQLELNGQTLSVSISAPPPRGEKAADLPKIESLGNAKRNTGTVGEKKPRLSFIPSSVLKKHTT